MTESLHCSAEANKDVHNSADRLILSERLQLLEKELLLAKCELKTTEKRKESFVKSIDRQFVDADFDPSVMLHECLSLIADGPPILHADQTSLFILAAQINAVEFVLKKLKFTPYQQIWDIVFAVLRRLPREMHDSWYDIAVKADRTGSESVLSNLAQFMKQKAEGCEIEKLTHCEYPSERKCIIKNSVECAVLNPVVNDDSPFIPCETSLPLAEDHIKPLSPIQNLLGSPEESFISNVQHEQYCSQSAPKCISLGSITPRNPPMFYVCLHQGFNRNCFRQFRQYGQRNTKAFDMFAYINWKCSAYENGHYALYKAFTDWAKENRWTNISDAIRPNRTEYHPI